MTSWLLALILLAAADSPATGAPSDAAAKSDSKTSSATSAKPSKTTGKGPAAASNSASKAPAAKSAAAKSQTAKSSTKPVALAVKPVTAAEKLKQARSQFEGRGDLTPQCPIDEMVFARLKELDIQPARLCTDEVFVRRVYFDVIGTLPTAEETRAFLESKVSTKRSDLIEQLLSRREFSDYWAMKWCDLLRVKSEFPINLWPNAVQAYHRWVRTSIRDNKPYDQFARELLTSSGSNFRVAPVNFYRGMQNREPKAIAQAVALTFMGTRAENWPPERLDGMAAFFKELSFKPTSEWKEEIVHFDALKADDDGETTATFPDGTTIRLSPVRDPRIAFADWLIRPENPWFARTVANRVWYWLLGRGIVHEPDDLRPDNPPSNPQLLAYLEQEFVKSHYDLKNLYRLILNSKTYQLSSLPRSASPAAEANFAYYSVRRLEAEVLIDAICQVTGTNEEYSSPIPEPFTFIPDGQRSITLADGSVSSPFLEMFGRSPRDTGLDAERNNKPSSAQRLHLLNSSHIRRKLEQGPNLRDLAQSGDSPEKIVKQLYLTILSRYPTEAEISTITAYSGGKTPRRETLVDVAWALLNSAEFQFRH